LKKGNNVSMGFGFVEFDSTETATSVYNNLQVITQLNQKMHAICI